MDEVFRQRILAALKERNRRAHQFTKLFDSYSELMERLASVSAQNDRLRKDGVTNDSPSGSEGGQSSSKELTDLRAQLNELYRQKTQNDQQLIDTNNRLQAKEKECDEIKHKYDQCLKQLSEMKTSKEALVEKMNEVAKTNQHLQDEYLALQTTYNGLENNHRKLQLEQETLIHRWSELKQQEADVLNEQNEQLLRQKQQRVRSDLNEAVSQPVPIYDEKTFELVNDLTVGASGGGGGGGYGSCDAVPTRLALQFEAHDSDVNCVKWSNRGKFFATGGSDRKIKIWEINDNNRMQDLKATVTGCNQAVMCLDFDQDDQQMVASSNDYAVRVWNVANKRCTDNFTGHSGKVFTAKFYQHGAALQVVSGSHDRTIKQWDMKSRRCIRTLFAGSTVHDLVTNKGVSVGPAVISGHFDKKLRFWDLRSDLPAYEVLMAARISSLDLSDDGKYVLCSTRDDSLYLIDLRTNQSLHTYCGETFKMSCDYGKAVLSPNGTFCCAGGQDGQLFIWRVNTTKIEKILTRGHDHPVVACSWHPSGQSILTCDKMRMVCLWTAF